MTRTFLACATEQEQHDGTDHEHSHETDTLPGLEPFTAGQASEINATTTNQASRQRKSSLLGMDLG